VTIDGGGQDRIFDISGLLVQMHELTLRNGAAKGTAVDDGGGAVRMMAGTFLVRGMLFANNRSESDGGAVLLSESRSIFSNSTFSANAADGSGGAVAVIAPTADYSGGTFASVTVAFNKADFDGDGSGHGGGFAISGPNSVVFAINSVLARNQDRSPDVPSRAPDCFAPDSGLSPMYLMSTQALGTPKCPVPPDGPYIRQFSPVDAKLRPLAGNGGPTRTHAIGVRSPAAGANRILNSHNELMCVTRDQRRRPRALGNCDLGAFQVHGATDPVRRISSRTALDLGSDVLLPVRCPARFRLECRAVVSIVVGGRRGRTAGSRTIRASSERSRAIAVTLRRPFRRRLAALTHEPGRYMLVRQVFTVTRDAVRRNPGRPVVVWERYRLRAYASPGGF
jgi:hypothetical protein